LLKKRLSLFILLAFVLSLIAVPVQNAVASDISVYINDQQQYFTPAPTVQSGTTLVPMRAFFEALGAEVEWNNPTKTVTGRRGNTTVILSIDSSIAYVNGQQKTLSIPAQLINGSTFIPLRFVGEALGDKVEYIPSINTIKVTSSVSVTPENVKLRVHFIDVGQGDCYLYSASFRPKHR